MMEVGDELTSEFGGRIFSSIVREITPCGRLLIEVIGGEADGLMVWVKQEDIDES